MTTVRSPMFIRNLALLSLMVMIAQMPCHLSFVEFLSTYNPKKIPFGYSLQPIAVVCIIIKIGSLLRVE